MSDERDCDCMNTYFHTCCPDDALAAGRHPKWQRVEPGTVIPAGQPYRTEWSDPSGDSANERVSSFQQTVPPPPEWFIDSSWKPPLVLPTEPTWGIAVHPSHGPRFGLWCLNETRTTLEDHGPRHAWQGVSGTCDFIPVRLTDEQVARIEAAR